MQGSTLLDDGAVLHGGVAAHVDVGGAAGQLDADEARVHGLRLEVRGVHRPGGVRVDDREVGRRARLEGHALDAQDLTGTHGHELDGALPADDARRHQVRDDERKRRL